MVEQFNLWDDILKFHQNENKPLRPVMSKEILNAELANISEKMSVSHKRENLLVNQRR